MPLLYCSPDGRLLLLALDLQALSRNFEAATWKCVNEGQGEGQGWGAERPVALGQLGDGEVRNRSDFLGAVREEHLQP